MARAAIHGLVFASLATGLIAETDPRAITAAAKETTMAEERVVDSCEAVAANKRGQCVTLGPAAARTPADAPRSAHDGFDLVRFVRSAGSRYGIDPALVLALIRVESGGEATAVSRGGAMGLMQLVPRTAERFGVRDPLDPRENVLGGVKYLRYLTDRYGNQLPVVLAAYQAGEGRVDRHGGIPPYPATQRFIERVLAVRDSLSATLAENGAAPSATSESQRKGAVPCRGSRTQSAGSARNPL